MVPIRLAGERIVLRRCKFPWPHGLNSPCTGRSGPQPLPSLATSTRPPQVVGKPCPWSGIEAASGGFAPLEAVRFLARYRC